MPTFTQIGSAVTVGAGGAATISFTSIPSTYTDLVLIMSGRTTSNQGSVWANTYVSTNLGAATSREVYGTGSATASTAASTGNIYSVSSLATANTFGSIQIYFPNYANTSYNKSASADAVGENNGTASLAVFSALLWSSTSAITSITLTPTGEGNYAQYSTAYLYGVSNA